MSDSVEAPADQAADGTSRITKRKLESVLSLLDAATLEPISDTRPTKRQFKVQKKEQTSTPALARLLRKKPTISKPQRPTKSDPYAPHSLPFLLNRLSTFPSSVSFSLQASLHGWSYNSRTRAITCSICHKQAYPATDATDEVFRAAHKDKCPWKNKWSEKDVYKVPAEGAKKDVMKRCEGLRTVQGATDMNVVNHIEDEDFIQAKSSGLPEVSDSILRLAIHGWQAQSSKVLSCPLCHRRIGTWLFSSSKPFDPVDEHRMHCPFASEEGWHIALRSIAPKKSELDTRKDVVGYVKSLLGIDRKMHKFSK